MVCWFFCLCFLLTCIVLSSELKISLLYISQQILLSWVVHLADLGNYNLIMGCLKDNGMIYIAYSVTLICNNTFVSGVPI